jgi:sugar phosphate isomerase/epimerase
MQFGLNLYSIRNLIQTHEDFLATAKKLKAMGYDYMQFSGGRYDVDSIKQVSKEADMPVCLTHVPYERIINETSALMEEHAQFHCKNIGLGSMPFDKLSDDTAFKETVELLNKKAEEMQKNGFRFFYHHHHFEFFRMGEKTRFDYMVENAPFINFTADTYWLQYGGMEITPTLQRLKGRIGCVHLKDYKIKLGDDGRWVPAIAPVGDGVLDFRNMIKQMQTLGVEHYLVEQDNAATLPDTLGQVERSIVWLQKEFQ